MAHYDFFKLLENKDRFIDNNPNLTPEQKAEIKDYFHSHNDQEKNIDWNNKNLKYEDFSKVMKTVTKNAQKKYRIFDVEEGKDYIKLGTEYLGDRFVEVYQPLTWKGSCALASNQMGPECWSDTPSWNGDDEANSWGKARGDGLKPGAKWCTAMHTTKKHWIEYTNDDWKLIYIFDPYNRKPELRKIGLSLDPDSDYVQAVNVPDEEIDRTPYDKIIYKYKDRLQETEFELSDEYKLNKDTGRYDVDNSDDELWFDNLLRDGKFVYPIGKVIGNFNLEGTSVTSLINGPTEVTGSFSISQCTSLTSLEGCPRVIGGSLIATDSGLTSLKGIAKKISRSLILDNTSIASFEGAEDTEVGSMVSAQECYFLVTCEGFPKAQGDIILSNCENLKSLEGLPESIVGTLYIDSCKKLRSLKGCPKIIGEGLYARESSIASFLGGPASVGKNCVLSGCPIKSLKWCPKSVDNLFIVERCPLNLDDTGTPEYVGGKYSGPITKGILANIPKEKIFNYKG